MSPEWIAATAALVAAFASWGTLFLCVWTLPHHLLQHPSWRRARREFQRGRAREQLELRAPLIDLHSVPASNLEKELEEIRLELDRRKKPSPTSIRTPGGHMHSRSTDPPPPPPPIS